MRKFDLVVQSILFAAALLSPFAFGKDWPLAILILQFFVGLWQLVSAIVTTARLKGDKRAVRTMTVYWTLVIVYALGAAFLFNKVPLFYFWFFSAWLIAVYYYVYTCKLALRKASAKKTFLDIANE